MNGFQRYSGVRFLEAGPFDSSDESILNRILPGNVRSDRYLGNFNFFYDYSETWIFGLELNLRTNFKNEYEYIVLPNVKYHISEKTNFHLGIGSNKELESQSITPIAVARFVIEI